MSAEGGSSPGANVRGRGLFELFIVQEWSWETNGEGAKPGWKWNGAVDMLLCDVQRLCVLERS